MTNIIRIFIKKPELVFVLLATFFGLFSLFLMPILEVPDENQHFQVEYAIFSSTDYEEQDIILSEAIVLSAVRNGSYDNYFLDKTSAEQDGIEINTDARAFGGDVKASAFDIMRLPQAVGVLLGRLIYPSIGVMVLLGRLFVLLVFIVAVYFIIKKVMHGKWVFVFVASLPIVIQQAASLSYDAINLIAIFAWLAFIINLFSQKYRVTPKQVALGLVLVLGLALTKANNLLLLALLLALPSRHITETKIVKSIHASRHWNKVKIGALILGALILFAGAYLMATRLLAGHPLYPRRLLHVLLNTFVWGDKGDLALVDTSVSGIIGQFSNFYYHLPLWVVVGAFSVFTVVLLHEKLPNVSKRFAILSGLIFFGSILAISIGMYYAWAMLPARLGPNAGVTDGIQGRYFTPLLVLLFPCFAYFQKHFRIVARSEATIPILVTSTSTFLLTYYLVLTWHFFWR